MKPLQSCFCSFIKINMFRICKQKGNLKVSDIKREDSKETQVKIDQKEAKEENYDI